MDFHFEVYLHAILAVDQNGSELSNKQTSRLFRYVKFSFENLESKVLGINGKTDHVHIVFKMNPNISLDELLKRVRLASSWKINNDLQSEERFAWENTYYAFTIGSEEIGEQIEYLAGQEEFHLTVSREEELEQLIEEYDLEYDGDDLIDITEDFYN